MTISHLLRPSSKLACYSSQHKYTGLCPVELNDIYRSLDILAESKKKLKKNYFT
ncbi:MAG: hypothetical protein H5T85_06750 [Actinobacteria bacterium]|nr:hypothetical protein [Actinomycetota bacterium]